MIFWEIAIIAILTLSGTIYLGTRLSSDAGAKAASLLEALEDKYQEAASTHFALLAAKGETPDEAAVERLVEALWVIAKPQIDGLLAYINSVNYHGVKIRYRARYFANAASIAEAYFAQRNKNKHKNKKALLGEGDEQKMRAAVKDAIRADLAARVLTLKMNEL